MDRANMPQKPRSDSIKHNRPDKSRRVFVVHGRDERLRVGLFTFLRSIGLEPLEFLEARKLTKNPSPYVGEILEIAFQHAQAVVVLLTPDDEARLGADFQRSNDPPHEKNLTRQPRPNVLFEAGMAVVSHPKQTILVQIGEVRPFSDAAGKHLVQMDNSTQKRQELASRLEDAGCPINLRGIDWHTDGDLTAKANSPEINADHLLELGPGVSATQDVFPRSNSTEFKEHVQKMMLDAHHIISIGIGLNILRDDPFRHDLMERAAKGKCHLEIYMADPQSPGVEMRLTEEELGTPKPARGAAGIQSLLEVLLQTCGQLEGSERIKIGLFTQYLTFALIIIDSHYYVYSYGFARLGDFSPVLHFSAEFPRNKSIIEFLDRQYQMVHQYSLEAHRVVRIRQGSCGKSENNLLPLAIYFVPTEDSQLYKFGCGVLGYDIRRQRDCTSLWKTEIGDASDYGFHITICDVLYFLTAAHRSIAVAEAKYLTGCLRRFAFRLLGIRKQFPNTQRVSIAIDDYEGGLETLHSEFVHRIYRRAIGSAYTLGSLSLPKKQTSRTMLMLNRYHAPYVLAQYMPHFTLANGVVEARQLSLVNDLERSFARSGSEEIVTVEKIAIMTKSSQGDKWVIEEELPLAR